MFNKIKRAYADLKFNLGNYKLLDVLHRGYMHDHKSAKVNLGQLQADANNKKKTIKDFSEVEFQVFSQFGDDGIIQWLVHQLPLPNKTFIEFGVENYREANTRFLLINNGWSGFVMDGSKKNIRELKDQQWFTFFDLEAECSFITTANINQLISLARFKKEIGILSIDIDGNDYWVWKAIENIEPAIIICEYNALFGFAHPYTINYEEDFVRGKKYPFTYYGISLLSAYTIAKERGYSFVGCNSAGNNAYFIHNSYMQHLSIPALTPEQGYVFQKFTEAFNRTTEEWYRGVDKIKSIDGLPVYNSITGETEKFNAAIVAESLIVANKLNRI